MFNKKVVFVIGAGASCEANLPPSEKFKTQISKMVNIYFERGLMVLGDPKIYDAICLHTQGIPNGDPASFVHGGRKIHEAIHQVSSIDSFIDNHFGDFEVELCGKLGICRAILKAELNSLLHFNSS